MTKADWKSLTPVEKYCTQVSFHFGLNIKQTAQTVKRSQSAVRRTFARVYEKTGTSSHLELVMHYAALLDTV